jgi:hypothetical protein
MKTEIDASINPATFGERLLFLLMSNPNKPIVIMRVGNVIHLEDGIQDVADD